MIIKDNFSLKILLDLKSSDLIKTYLIRQDNNRRTLTLNLQPTSKWDRKAATNGFQMAVVAFGPNTFPTEATWSCQRLPTT